MDELVWKEEGYKYREKDGCADGKLNRWKVNIMFWDGSEVVDVGCSGHR